MPRLEGTSHKPCFYVCIDYLDIIIITVCDWEIEVNNCIGFCQLTSPGYPGIYPPHAMCNYHLVNRDGERVQLYLSGTSRDKGKFDLKKT